MNPLIRLYPRAWRDRYGEEIQALLDDRPLHRRDRLDMIRGALDAWLHPAAPSRVPVAAALTGGGLWTVAATGVLAAPAPPDWPGYLVEIVPLALSGTLCLFVAVTGCLLRAGVLGSRMFAAAFLLTAIGYVGWVAALGGTLVGTVGGPALAAAQAVAMVATVMVGLALARGRDEPVGLLLLAAAGVMLVPMTGTWLVFGLGWTAIGIWLFVDRAARIAGDGIAGSAGA